MEINNTGNKSEYFETSNLALATVISITFPIVQIKNKDTGKAIFVFDYSTELTQLVETYWKKELRVEPQEYFDQLRTIKSRLYEGV